MALPFSISKTDAVIVLMNRCKQIGIYSKASNAIVAAFSLKNSVSGTICRVGLWADASTIYADWAPIPGNTVETINVDFGNSDGDIWNDDGNVVIGIGDMRDGYAYTKRYNLKNVGPKGFVIAHANDNSLNIYSTVAGVDTDITISLNSCS